MDVQKILKAAEKTSNLTFSVVQFANAIHKIKDAMDAARKSQKKNAKDKFYFHQ